MSTNGASFDVGTTATIVGDFRTLWLDINPTYTFNGYPQCLDPVHRDLQRTSGGGRPGPLPSATLSRTGARAGLSRITLASITHGVQLFRRTPTPTPTPTPTVDTYPDPNSYCYANRQNTDCPRQHLLLANSNSYTDSESHPNRDSNGHTTATTLRHPDHHADADCYTDPDPDYSHAHPDPSNCLTL